MNSFLFVCFNMLQFFWHILLCNKVTKTHCPLILFFCLCLFQVQHFLHSICQVRQCDSELFGVSINLVFYLCALYAVLTSLLND